MNVDWLLVLNILRIIFTIIILGYASFRDIKTRLVANQVWIIFGLIGISLIECQIIIEFGMNAFSYLLAIIPLTILFMSFLVCDNIIDFEKREFNDSWVFLIVLAGFAFFYLFLFGPEISNGSKKVEKIQIFLPVILLLLYFVLIQSVLNFLESRAYRSYKEVLKKKKKEKSRKQSSKFGIHHTKSSIQTKNTKPHKATKIVQPITSNKTKNPEKKFNVKDLDLGQSKTRGEKSKNDKKTETLESDDKNDAAGTNDEVDTKLDYRFSWTLFFGLLSSTIVMFIMTDIIEINIVRMVGRGILIFIPIILILLYLHYRTEARTKGILDPDSDEDIDNIDGEDDEDIEISIEELEFKPPNKFMSQSAFAALILFGFTLIIYYSIIEVLMNIIVQLFVLMAWLLIFYGFYNLGLPRGGADTKALMALILVFPAYPVIQYITIEYPFFELIDEFILIGYIFPFAFSVLINGALIVLFYLLALMIYNATRHDLKFPHAMLGYKLPIRDVKKRFVWLMEKIVDGERKLIAFPGGDKESDLNKELQLLRDANVKSVWVTPKIPFIIPLSIGFILTLIIGNLMFVLIGLFG